MAMIVYVSGQPLPIQACMVRTKPSQLARRAIRGRTDVSPQTSATRHQTLLVEYFIIFYKIIIVFSDNMILYGGGWNSQKDPEDNKVIKPYYGYYGLEATDSPWKFKVVHASQKIPAPDRTKHKGKLD